MKRAFQQYYASSEDLDALLRRAFIILDTNALLNLYRSSEKTSDELLKLLGAAKPQLWMPYQIGLEYHQNLEDVLSELRTRHRGFGAVLDEGLNKLRAVFGEYRHPFIREYVLAAIDDLETGLRQEFEKSGWGITKLNERAQRVRQTIEDIYDDQKVGDDFSDEELREIVKDGESRYQNGIPPGFKDARKTADVRRPYGDLVLWKQMIAQAKASATPIVFVTDDTKDDWWLRIRGEIKGPLPTLRAEMMRESGQDYYSYTTESFLKYAAPIFLERAADTSAVADVERASRAEELSGIEVERKIASVPGKMSHDERQSRDGFYRWMKTNPEPFQASAASRQFTELMKSHPELFQPSAASLAFSELMKSHPELFQPSPVSLPFSELMNSNPELFQPTAASSQFAELMKSHPELFQSSPVSLHFSELMNNNSELLPTYGAKPSPHRRASKKVPPMKPSPSRSDASELSSAVQNESDADEAASKETPVADD